jgi:hypothetical protein
VAAAICLAGLLRGSLCPADDRVEPDRKPFALLSIASLDRALDDLEFVLDSAGQADRALKVRTVLDVLNRFEALDQDRPLGLLLYLPATPPHKPEAVAFLPVPDFDRLEDTIAAMQRFSLEREADSSRFELHTPDKTLAGLHSGDWVFLTEHESLLDGPLSDHLAAAPTDFEGHDAVLTLRRDGIPETVFEEALRKLHSDLEQDLERRDEETVAEHRFRSRVSRAIVATIERFLTDAENAMIGLEVSEVDKQARMEVRLKAEAGSPLSQRLEGLARPDSRFSAIAQETAPLTIAATWRLNGEPADIASELLAHVRSHVAGTTEQPRERPGPHPFERILTALSETIDAGQLDGLVQFVDAPDGKFVLVAGVHLEESDSVAIALRDIMQYLAQSNSDGKQTVAVNALQVGDVWLHRIRGKNVRRQDRRLYGDDVALFVGAGRDAIWFAVGGAHTQTALQRVILAELPSSPDDGQSLPLFEASMHFSNWIELAGTGQTEREQKLFEAARRAFRDAEEDGLHLELFADETGMQLYVEAERGYIRLLGVVLAARMRQ